MGGVTKEYDTDPTPAFRSRVHFFGKIGGDRPPLAARPLDPRDIAPKVATTAVDGRPMSSNAAALDTRAAVYRVVLPALVRLRDLPALLAMIREGLATSPTRIELDARGVRVLSEGARRLLLAATERLASMHVELVLVDCDPFD